MADFTVSAREAARIGRTEQVSGRPCTSEMLLREPTHHPATQLRTLEKFEAGQRVTFAVHNGPGYELHISEAKPKPSTSVACVVVWFLIVG